MNGVYTFNGTRRHRVAVVRTAAALPERPGTHLRYFEVRVVSMGKAATGEKNCPIGVGFLAPELDAVMPGCDQPSYGWHGDDGNLFLGRASE